MSMIICPNKNIGFYHYHKTYGISLTNFFCQEIERVETLLVDGVEHHPPLSDLLKKYLDKILSLDYCFTTIRNPEDHVVSLYFFWLKMGVEEATSRNLDQFIDYWNNDEDWMLHISLNGRIPDWLNIVRCEDLSSFLRKKFGIKSIMPLLNNNNDRQNVELTKSQKKRIRERYSLWESYYNDE